MPYVPQDVKERIKREVSIQRRHEGSNWFAAARSLSACARSMTTGIRA